MKKIKTFEDACKALKLDPKALPDFSAQPEEERKALLAHYKLVIIAKALNGGWKPDWNDWGENKYYPWFDCRGGFSYGDCGYYDRDSDLGSRLCFKSRELAEYVGKQFIDLYKEYFIN